MGECGRTVRCAVPDALPMHAPSQHRARKTSPTKVRLPRMTAQMNPRQRAFVHEYLVDGNATQAAIRAGYSETSAYAIGHENLKKHEIRDAIAEAQAKREAKLNLRGEDVLRRLKCIAEMDPLDFFDEHGHPVALDEVPEHARLAVKALEVGTVKNEDGSTTVVRKYRFESRLKALEALGKHLQLFVEKVQMEHSGKLERIIDLARRIRDEKLEAPREEAGPALTRQGGRAGDDFRPACGGAGSSACGGAGSARHGAGCPPSEHRRARV
jgi:phage terminase small subunit